LLLRESPGSREEVGPMAGQVAQPRALGAEMSVMLIGEWLCL